MKDYSSLCEYRENEPLAKHSSFRIGGTADLAFFPKTSSEAVAVIEALRKDGIRYSVIGRGSNVLFDDRGYHGAIVFTDKMNRILYDGVDTFTCDAGVSVATLCFECEKNGLYGMEFAYGIPGSVGGALYMNAGAYGGEFSTVTASVEVYDADAGTARWLSGDLCRFSYRHSIFQEKSEWVILSALLRLNAGGSVDEIRQKMQSYLASRKGKQPLEYPSAGSFFKRPEGNFAGKLIEDAGLKGMHVGDAMISEKHAGFLVNVGGARSTDVLALAEIVSDTVEAKFGVKLEPEVRIIPYEN